MPCGPGTFNLTIRRGITLGPITFTLYGESGVFDLTGYSVFAEIKTAAGATAIVKNLSPTISSATGGQITITLTDEATQALTAGSYAWDLILQDAGGARTGPYLAGEAIVEETVTTHA